MFVIKPNLRLKLAESQIEGGGSMHFPNLGTQNCRIWQHHSRIWKLSYNRSSEKGESQICEKFKYEKFKCRSPTLAQKNNCVPRTAREPFNYQAPNLLTLESIIKTMYLRVYAPSTWHFQLLSLYTHFFNQRSPMHVGSRTLECPEPRQRQ